MRNPVGWFEIACSDLERAKEFYSKVFGYEFQFLDMPDSPMYFFPGGEDGLGASGSLVVSEYNIPSKEGVMIYFSSEDCNIELAKVEVAGGQISMPKMSIGEFGHIGMFIDTEGNRIGIHSMK